MPTPWILISIGALVIILAVIAIFAAKHRDKNRKPDYYTFFIIGIIWLPFGLIMTLTNQNTSIGNIFAVLGLFYIILGLAHKKEWKTNRRPPLLESKTARWILAGLATLLLLGIAFYLTLRTSV